MADIPIQIATDPRKDRLKAKAAKLKAGGLNQKEVEEALLDILDLLEIR